MESLGVLDVDGLNIAVQLLLGALLVISSSGNSHAQPVGNTLNTLLPDLLVELRVQTDVGGTLFCNVSPLIFPPGCPAQLGSDWRGDYGESYHGLLGESLDLLDGAGSPLLEGNTVHLHTRMLASRSINSKLVGLGPRSDVLSCACGWCTRGQQRPQ